MKPHALSIALSVLSLPTLLSAQRDDTASLFQAIAALTPATTPGSSVGWNSITEHNVTSLVNIPGGITLGPDGALWFAEGASQVGPGRIGRITTSGTITEYTPLGGCCINPVGITAGPDGALWFTDNNAIGRITTDGVITEFPILSPPSCCANPLAITAGPDGALWFTDSTFQGTKIGRITTAGVVTEFPAAVSNPFSITGGPDGALWFTEPGNSRIGRITTAGAITEYPLSGFGNPQGITTGPDGALWFTEFGTGKIGRITIQGVLTEYPLAPNSSPSGITVGPDQALWFTESNANRIGRITTAGFITEYPVPIAGSSPMGIAAGPDGGLWFTQFNSNSIGRAWACGIGLNLSFANSTLDIGFDLGVATPATFGTWLVTGQGFNQLWSKSMAAVVPPLNFIIPLGPRFPHIGNVAVFSTLSVPATGLICYESQTANTGGAGPTIAELQHLILRSGILQALP